MSKRKRPIRPQWLVEFRRRTAIIDIIDQAFEENCDCSICRQLRKVAADLEEFLVPPPSTKGRR